MVWSPQLTVRVNEVPSPLVEQSASVIVQALTPEPAPGVKHAVGGALIPTVLVTESVAAVLVSVMVRVTLFEPAVR